MHCNTRVGPQRGPCRAPDVASGRGGSCALHCMWSSRLCRLCCAAKTPGDEHAQEHATERGDRAESTEEPAATPEEPATGATDHATKGDPDGPKLVFPNQLPEGTQVRQRLGQRSCFRVMYDDGLE